MNLSADESPPGRPLFCRLLLTPEQRRFPSSAAEHGNSLGEGAGKSVSLHSLLSVWQLLNDKRRWSGLGYRNLHWQFSLPDARFKQGHVSNLESSLSNLTALQNPARSPHRLYEFSPPGTGS